MAENMAAHGRHGAGEGAESSTSGLQIAGGELA